MTLSLPLTQVRTQTSKWHPQRSNGPIAKWEQRRGGGRDKAISQDCEKRRLLQLHTKGDGSGSGEKYGGRIRICFGVWRVYLWTSALEEVAATDRKCQVFCPPKNSGEMSLYVRANPSIDQNENPNQRRKFCERGENVCVESKSLVIFSGIAFRYVKVLNQSHDLEIKVSKKH